MCSILIRGSLAGVALLNLCVHAFSQDASLVPSIRKEFAASANDTLRADAMARLCFNLIHSDPDSARHYGDKALGLALRIGHERAIADAHNNLGWLDTQQGRFDAAEAHFKEALTRFRRIGNPAFISIALSNMGWCADKQGDRAGALRTFQEALNNAELAKDSASTSILLYSIGTTYNKLRQWPDARNYIERSLAYEQAMERPSKAANCLVVIGNTYRSEGDTGLAIVRYEEAARMYKGNGDHYGLGMVSENTGDLFISRDPQRALRLYDDAYAHYDTLASPVDQAYILQRRADVHLRLGRSNEARSDLDSALSLAKRAGAPEIEMEVERSLAELFSTAGDGPGTRTHFERFIALKDSLQGADTDRELARLRTAFETERKEQENALLKQENELRRANEKRLRNRWIAALAAAFGILGLLLLLWRNYRLRGRHTHQVETFNRELLAQRDQVQRMNDLLELKVLRSQLNPHFIYNCQNSAIAMIKDGRPVEALAYLQGLARLLRMILEHCVKDRVTVEEECDFLRQYLKLESIRLDGLKYLVSADTDLIEDEASMPALLVQPFVENALWHGLAVKEGARTLAVSFRSEGDRLICTVSDNGIGRNWDPGRPGHRSLGTELTNERLQLLTHRLQQKGSFRIIDLKNDQGGPKGTQVVIELDM